MIYLELDSKLSPKTVSSSSSVLLTWVKRKIKKPVVSKIKNSGVIELDSDNKPKYIKKWSFFEID